jgi:hypothetical protein
LGCFSQQPLPGFQPFPDKDIRAEFARQFNIAQTFGQDRAAIEDEGNTQVWPVEIKAWGSMSPGLKWFIPRKLITQILPGVANQASFSRPSHERECASKNLWCA